ncbi:DUF445 domain-containing protein [uncultured Veillonella sp.]|uniref:DUF445 domain-containing protein n=1 Tax=uncultured Veillonella sp. TaxID=159268 RepID=UPI00262121AC|nr:DUF445 domain-containing protein [uncultured Veillonella sp.]
MIRGVPYRVWANRILAVSALLYGLVFIGQFYITATWYDALYWLVQSALIGSVADWFAVTALFRKPLGFPYHTALIPRNKDRLINGIIHLVETRLLTYEQCERALRNVRFVPYINGYVKRDRGRQAIRRSLRSMLHVLWHSRSEREWAQWGSKVLSEFLHKQNITGPIQQFLTEVCGSNKHETLIIRFIIVLQGALDKPQVLHWLTDTIDKEIQARKDNFLSALVISVSEATDIINARDMAMAMLRELYMILERWKRPGSTERLVWMQQWLTPLQELAYNSTVTKTIDSTWQQWIDDQDWDTILLTYVCPYIHNIIHMADANDAFEEETPVTVLEKSLQELWAVYSEKPEINRKIENMCQHMGQYILARGHAMLSVVVRQVLGALSTEKFIQFIESKVEDDLSWIRINGAIVGAVCGLGAWSFLHFIYEPLLAMWGL